MTTPNLGLTELIAAQAQPEIPVNQTFRALDTLVQMAVSSIAAAPPGSPVDGERHIVDTGATGAFAGHDADIAYWVAGTFNEWRFVSPGPGWLAYVVALDKFYYHQPGSPGAWVVTAII